MVSTITLSTQLLTWRSPSARLSEILRHQASLLEHIVTEQRYYPEYYKVTYYGNFPGAVRNKRIIVSIDSTPECFDILDWLI
jgi:hypothetical protein